MTGAAVPALVVIGRGKSREVLLIAGWCCRGASGSRGQESAPIDPGLIAVAITLAQCPPGPQLLRAHPLPVIQVVHPTAKRALPVWPEETHGQQLPPRERRERVGLTPETDAGDLIDSHVHRPARRVVAELDVPPAPVGRAAEQVRCHAGEVRDPPADAEDKRLQPDPGRSAIRRSSSLAGSPVSVISFMLRSSPVPVSSLVKNMAPRKIHTGGRSQASIELILPVLVYRAGPGVMRGCSCRIRRGARRWPRRGPGHDSGPAAGRRPGRQSSRWPRR